MRRYPILIFVLSLALVSSALADASQRSVAVTFDDLPMVEGPRDIDGMREGTKRMLDVLVAHGVPATGFVTESKLHVRNEMDERIGILEMWLDAGMRLGNHTFSHASLNDTPVDRYLDDIIKGEVVTRRLMDEKGLTLEYFRYPYTRTGPTEEIQSEVLAFLHDRGYRIAPFTVENSDYAFNAVYVEARDDGDPALAERVRSAYLDFQDTIFRFFEELSVDLFGYEIRQILLIHANQLQIDSLDELLSRLESRGYRFVSLDEALEDEAFQTPDEYVGPMGPSWLHRWSIQKGVPMREIRGRLFPGSLLKEPDPPQFILDRYQALNK